MMRENRPDYHNGIDNAAEDDIHLLSLSSVTPACNTIISAINNRNRTAVHGMIMAATVRRPHAPN